MVIVSTVGGVFTGPNEWCYLLKFESNWWSAVDTRKCILDKCMVLTVAGLGCYYTAHSQIEYQSAKAMAKSQTIDHLLA